MGNLKSKFEFCKRYSRHCNTYLKEEINYISNTTVDVVSKLRKSISTNTKMIILDMSTNTKMIILGMSTNTR